MSNKYDQNVILQNIQAVVWESDFETNEILYINDYIETMLGYPVERWMNEPNFFAEVLHPEDRSWVLEHSQKQTANYSSYGADFRVITAHGDVIWVRNAITIKELECGKILKCGYAIDITSLKEHEKLLSVFADQLEEVIESKNYELCDVKEKYNALNQVTEECVFKVSDLGLIEYIEDKKLAEDLGLCKDGHLCQDHMWLEMVYEEDAKRIKTAWTDMITFKIPMKIEFRTRDKNGKLMWMMVEMKQMYDSSKISYVGSLTNITLEREILPKLLELKNSGATWT